MKRPHLWFYKNYCNTGKMPFDGLCGCVYEGGLLSGELLSHFEPTFSDEKELRHNQQSTVYWASGLHMDDDSKFDTFTPLRQTIVLLMAAMNNEL